MTKHTPGPWHFIDTIGCTGYIYDARERWPLMVQGAHNPNWQADMMIAKAAPEMLAALEEACKQCGTRGCNLKCTGCRIEAAIKKARGEGQ